MKKSKRYIAAGVALGLASASMLILPSAQAAPEIPSKAVAISQVVPESVASGLRAEDWAINSGFNQPDGWALSAASGDRIYVGTSNQQYAEAYFDTSRAASGSVSAHGAPVVGGGDVNAYVGDSDLAFQAGISGAWSSAFDRGGEEFLADFGIGGIRLIGEGSQISYLNAAIFASAESATSELNMLAPVVGADAFDPYYFGINTDIRASDLLAEAGVSSLEELAEQDLIELAERVLERRIGEALDNIYAQIEAKIEEIISHPLYAEFEIESSYDPDRLAEALASVDNARGLLEQYRDAGNFNTDDSVLIGAPASNLEGAQGISAVVINLGGESYPLFTSLVGPNNGAVYNPTLSPNPVDLYPGEVTRITGEGFVENTDIQIILGDGEFEEIWTFSDEEGNFEVEFLVPEGTEAGPRSVVAHDFISRGAFSSFDVYNVVEAQVRVLARALPEEPEEPVYEPSTAVNPDRVEDGEETILTGEGFPENEQAIVSLLSPEGEELARVEMSTSEDGAIETPIRVPEGSPASNSYTVRTTVLEHEIDAALEVTNAQAPEPEPEVPGGEEEPPVTEEPEEVIPQPEAPDEVVISDPLPSESGPKIPSRVEAGKFSPETERAAIGGLIAFTLWTATAVGAGLIFLIRQRRKDESSSDR